MNRRYLSLLVTAGLAATAGLAFHRVFGFGPVLPVAAVAAIVPTALSALLSGPRKGRAWPLWISLVLTVLAWFGTVVLTVLRPALAGGTFPVALRDGVLSSWKSILTTLLPAPAKPEFLVLVHVLVWLAAFASAELALRTPLRAAPGLPALGVFGVALMLGVDGPGSNLGLVTATVVLLVALVLLRSGTEETKHAWRPMLAGLPVAAALGALALVAAPLVPVSAEPYNPREQVQAPPPQNRDSVSPLDRVGGWLLSPEQAMFTAKGGQAPHWRLAVLDRFDGVTWSSTARFAPTGSRVPEADDTVDRVPVAQQITIRHLPGVWVPAAERPREVTGLGVVVDPASGALAAAQELKPGQTYRVASEKPEPDTEDLAGASIAQDAEARATRDLPWGPGATKAPVQIAEFRRFAQGATKGALSPFVQASMLAEYLQRFAKFNVAAPPGHSYRQLDYFLGEGRSGTPEHFATAYAVLARSLGLPTRIMVGFQGGSRAGDTVEVSSGDVMVWPEVKFEGIGWHAFYPTPQQAGKKQQSNAVATGETQKLQQAQKNAASQKRGTGKGATPDPPPNAAKPVADESLPAWVYGTAVVVLLVLGYLLAVLIAPVLRKRGRRSGTPADSIAGAWHHALEHLADVGLATARTLTAHEVAHFGFRNVGEAAQNHLRPLADLVNRTRFAPDRPDPRAADQAWQHSDEVGRLVTAKAGRRRRLLRRLHPRSLRRGTR